ncbi:MAG: hypothetical protein AAF202_12110, partial [Pseudomonadota bacterium]
FLVFSSNTQKLVIIAFTLTVSLVFNACGNPLSNQVTISTDPKNPAVVKIDIPEDDDGFEGATAPWFILDYVIANSSDQTFILTRLEFTSNRLGDDTITNSTAIEVSQLEDGQGYDEYPLAIAVVDPESEWQSSINGGSVSNNVRQGLVWYIGSLPVDENESTEEQTTLYEVNVLATGFFVPDASSDDDDFTVYERSFRIFTE